MLALEIRQGSVGSVVSIRGDGNCAYHLIATVFMAFQDPCFLFGGVAPCFQAMVPLAREQAAVAFIAWCETQPIEGRAAKVMTVFGSTSEKILNGIRGGRRWGGIQDISMALHAIDIQTVCLRAERVKRDRGCHVLDLYERYVHIPNPKYLVCAVYFAEGGHWDLGVVNNSPLIPVGGDVSQRYLELIVDAVRATKRRLWEPPDEKSIFCV
jgi:hypothetical protein